MHFISSYNITTLAMDGDPGESQEVVKKHQQQKQKKRKAATILEKKDEGVLACLCRNTTAGTCMSISMLAWYRRGETISHLALG